MEKKDKHKIRDNSRIILGLTGYLGSGCTILSHMLAFDIKNKLNEYLVNYDENKVNTLFSEIASLKKLNDKDPSLMFNNPLLLKNTELKKALERREIKNILERHKDKLLANEFFYISFSQIIILFVVRYLRHCDDKLLELAVGNILTEIGFTTDEAVELCAKFTIRKMLRKGDTDQDKLIRLFSQFSKIRDKVIELKGKKVLQDYGDSIRRYGTPFPGLEIKKGPKLNGRWLAIIVDRYMQLCSRKYKYIVIECFKNPQELYYFREKYSNFYLIAINAPKDIRQKRTGLSKEIYDKVERRERGLPEEADELADKLDFCHLDVARCIDIADIVISNDTTLDELFHKLLKYTTLILEPGAIKPTQTETLMHIAYTLSVRSYCLSRQVGAVIVNSDGYVIGAGWNDVGEGQLSCGLKMGQDYSNEYIKNEELKISPEEGRYYLCIKDKYKEIAVQKELCPVLHAEENAILQLAMYNSGVTRNGIVYSTTFPCINCLKKISQIGITKVIYCENYDNPGKKLFVEQNIKTLKLEPFEGVKSYSYFKLFKSYYDMKEQQKLY